MYAYAHTGVPATATLPALSCAFEENNADPKPFVWKSTAEEIIAKVQRGRDALHQIKSATDH